jgi:hypothetical protein
MNASEKPHQTVGKRLDIVGAIEEFLNNRFPSLFGKEQVFDFRRIVLKRLPPTTNLTHMPPCLVRFEAIQKVAKDHVVWRRNNSMLLI